jgi:hypothetical protein
VPDVGTISSKPIIQYGCILALPYLQIIRVYLYVILVINFLQKIRVTPGSELRRESVIAALAAGIVNRAAGKWKKYTPIFLATLIEINDVVKWR